MQAELDVTVVSDGSVVHLAVGGEIDEATVVRFGRALKDAIHEAVTEVALDLSEVTFIGSAGLSVLLRALELADESNIRFWIPKASAQVDRVLDLVGAFGALRKGPDVGWPIGP